MLRKSLAAIFLFPVILFGQGASFPPRGGSGGGSTTVPGTSGQIPTSNGSGGFGSSVTPSRCLTTDCGNTANFSGPSISTSLIPTTLGGMTIRSITAPTATATATCSGTCATTYTYVPVGISGPGGAEIEPGSTTSASNATSLDSTHYNTINVACSDSLTSSVSVYRTVPTGSKGLLGTVACGGSITDTGAGLNGATAPTVNTTGKLGVGVASLPATCTVGQLSFLTTGSVGLYQCLATDTWSIIAGGATVAWGAITGTLASQTDVSSAISAKLSDPLTTRGDLVYRGAGGTTRLSLGTNGYCLTSDGTDAVWASCPGGGANASGYYLVSRSTNAPTNAVNLGALTTGLMKLTVSGSVATPSTAASGTDYAPATSGTSILKGDGSGGFSSATAGTDYMRPGQVYSNLVSIANSDSPYTVASTAAYILCNATSGAVVINLPAATGTGREITVKKTDSSANACTPTRAGSDTIDGATSYSLTTQYASSKVVDAASAAWHRSHVNQVGGALGGISTAATITGISSTQYMLPVSSSTVGQLGTSTTLLNGGKFYPSADSTTAIQFTKADGSTAVMVLDTTNARVAINGSAATDSAPLGSETVDGTGWTSTNWTGSYPYTHTVGNTSALSRSITGMANNTYWQVVFTVSGRTAGSISVSIGGTALEYTSGEIAANATYTRGVRAVGTGALTFTPTTDFDGQISSVSVKAISQIASNSFELKDSLGNVSLGILAPLAALENIYQGGGGRYNTTGSSNSAHGTNSMYSNTTGSSNVAQGAYALYSNTTGSSNLAQGAYALYSNTIGSFNVADGANALRSNTTGYYNSAHGANALRSNTTGYYNSAHGAQVLYSNTTGHSNSAHGTYALYFNTTGYYNSAHGANALQSNTTGYYNSAHGAQALYSNTTGHHNAAQGINAGYTSVAANATTTGSYQVLLGYNSGQASATQRDYLTVVGAEVVGDCANCGILGKAGQKWGVGGVNNPSATFHIYDSTATIGATLLTITAGAGQGSSSLIELRNNTGTLLSSFDQNGNLAANSEVSAGVTAAMTGSGLQLFTTGLVNWSSTAAYGGAADTGLARNAAGVMEVHSGTAGRFADIKVRHLRTGTVATYAPAPTISSGFGTSPSIAGSDSAGRVTIGTPTGTSGVIAFGTAWANAPACTANDEVTGVAITTASTTTQLTLAGAFVAADTVVFTCIGY